MQVCEFCCYHYSYVRQIPCNNILSTSCILNLSLFNNNMTFNDELVWLNLYASFYVQIGKQKERDLERERERERARTQLETLTRKSKQKLEIATMSTSFILLHLLNLLLLFPLHLHIVLAKLAARHCTTCFYPSWALRRWCWVNERPVGGDLVEWIRRTRP